MEDRTNPFSDRKRPDHHRQHDNTTTKTREEERLLKSLWSDEQEGKRYDPKDDEPDHLLRCGRDTGCQCIGHILKRGPNGGDADSVMLLAVIFYHLYSLMLTSRVDRHSKLEQRTR